MTLESLDDASLVRRTLEGDEPAFGVLMERYARLIASIAYAETRNFHDAEDIVQEAFLSGYRSLATLRDPKRFAPWMVRIARRRLADFHRNARRRPLPVSPGLKDGSEDGPAWPETADLSPSPRELSQSRQLRAVILNEIEGLGKTYGSVIYLRLMDELSAPEIAHRLGLKHGTVRMRLQRGLKSLRKRLEKRGLDFPPRGESDHDKKKGDYGV